MAIHAASSSPVASWARISSHIRVNCWLGEPLAAAQQPPPVRPGRVTGGAAAAQDLAGDPLPDPGDGLVGEPDQVEVIDDDDRVRQRLGDGGPVDRARVDGHVGDLVLPVLAAVIQPAGDGRAGPPGDLAEQPARCRTGR